MYFFADYDDLSDLTPIEQVILRETLEDFAVSVISVDNRSVMEVITEYNPWIMWCLKHPEWAVKFRAGE